MNIDEFTFLEDLLKNVDLNDQELTTILSLVLFL